RLSCPTSDPETVAKCHSMGVRKHSGTSSGANELAFVDFECSDLRFQCRGGYAELYRGAGRTGNLSVCLSKHRFNKRLFVGCKSTTKRDHGFGRRGLPREPVFIDRKRFSLANDHGSLDHVLQLSNVAGPTIGLE